MNGKSFKTSQLLDKLEVTSRPCVGPFAFIENMQSHYENKNNF